MLYVVATPIGDYSEISLKALEVFKQCQTIICESTKETSKLLRHHQISGKTYELLNEHTERAQLMALVELCKTQDVCVVSDCGTPGFCDPGADLVQLCYTAKVPVKTVLGASALMGLLSLCGMQLKEFLFKGFLSPETVSRREELLKLAKEKRAIILMDTPYRMKKTLQDVNEHFSARKIFLAGNLSQENQFLLQGSPKKVLEAIPEEKAEFMLLIYPL